MTTTPESSILEKAAAFLGVSASAPEAELRSAYLKKVQQHPPDRDPEMFERIRDAYEQLKNPTARAWMVVTSGPDPNKPLISVLDGVEAKREFVGSTLWSELLKERRK